MVVKLLKLTILRQLWRSCVWFWIIGKGQFTTIFVLLNHVTGARWVGRWVFMIRGRITFIRFLHFWPTSLFRTRRINNIFSFYPYLGLSTWIFIFIVFIYLKCLFGVAGMDTLLLFNNRLTGSCVLFRYEILNFFWWIIK